MSNISEYPNFHRDAKAAALTPVISRPRTFIYALLALALGLLAIFAGLPANAQSIAFKQAVAQAAAKDKAIAAFYKARNYKPIWTSNKDRQRRLAFVSAAAKAQDHGLPVGRYDAAQLKRDFGGIKSAKAKGILEVETSRKFLQYARDIQSGILEPRKIDRNMTLRPPRRDRLKTLTAFAKSSPKAFFKSLPPSHPDYARLLKEKVRIERIIARGGWGPKVKAKKLELGQSSKAVTALRKRLSAMGYKQLGQSKTYDAKLVNAVKQFQIDSGLNADGAAGGLTLAAVNVPATQRLMQVVIGLERLRWLNKPLGKRHIMVNEADFRATVYDNGKPTLVTRVVVGKAGRWRTPEFEKKMTHMVINPSWFVPGSIAGGEYLPLLKKNANAMARQGIEIRDITGRRVDPTSIDFSQYSKDNFPFSLKQPPSGGNALGRVKFMFPNKHAIYLHDTPAKSLFGRDVRAYSHGCVRVQKPLELAYTLLSKQSSNPKKLFNDALASGQEVTIQLKKPVPIYLVYRTAWVTAKGRPNYRRDTYAVDKKVFSALSKAGVVLKAARS
ncbi:MAG: L,D-transpeptidase family protein [Alphaproteobacteria bacterium]|nr:L,D-transpeptidase family protein [Alphaproteobacteria bacterium]